MQNIICVFIFIYIFYVFTHSPTHLLAPFVVAFILHLCVCLWHWFGLFACVSQGANLQGVKMLCTNAEGASLKGCNFEDPAGLKANLEGKMSTLDFWTASRGSHIPSK